MDKNRIGKMKCVSSSPGGMSTAKQKIQGSDTIKRFTVLKKRFNIVDAAYHSVAFPVYFVKIRLIHRCELYPLKQ